jgi:hypothetical protein
MRGFDCDNGSEETKVHLRAIRAVLDPMDLPADIEARLGKISTIVECIEEDSKEEMERAGESYPLRAGAGRKTLSKPPQRSKPNSSAGCHESWHNDFTPPVSFIIGAIWSAGSI